MADTTGLKPHSILDFILKSHDLDMKEQIGRSNNAKVMFLGANMNACQLLKQRVASNQ